MTPTTSPNGFELESLQDEIERLSDMEKLRILNDRIALAKKWLMEIENNPYDIRKWI